MNNQLNLNKIILEEIKDCYDDLLAMKGEIGRLPNKTIAGLLEINEKTFSSGLNTEGYLLWLLPKLYKALKNHSNQIYKKLSKPVLDISLREMTKSFGEVELNELESAFSNTLRQAPMWSTGSGTFGRVIGAAIGTAGIVVLQKNKPSLLKRIINKFSLNKEKSNSETKTEWYSKFSTTEKEKILEMLEEKQTKTTH